MDTICVGVVMSGHLNREDLALTMHEWQKLTIEDEVAYIDNGQFEVDNPMRFGECSRPPTRLP